MHSDPLAPILVIWVIILVSAKLGGELFERLGQPSVLGELMAGVILGNIILLNPDWTFFEPLRIEAPTEGWANFIDLLARLGVILLLFEVGLESTVAEMREVGKSSLLVAATGVIAPFVLGFGISMAFIREIPAGLVDRLPADFNLINIHIFIGAALCATSVGITARVFKDLGKLQTKEAKIILGAAVIDDVLGLIILAAVVGMVGAAMTGQEFSFTSIAKITFIALGSLTASIVLGTLLAPRIIRFLWKLHTQGVAVITALIFCFMLSWLADEAGLAAIVGSFAAGLILEEVYFKGFKDEVTLHQLIRPISTIFVPIFFVLMGIRVRIENFANIEILGLTLSVTLAAIIGKQVCGLVIGGQEIDRLSIGVGMIPRGEVGLIFAGIGQGIGIFDASLFSAMVIMVIITTLITPPVLKLTLSRWEKKTSCAQDK
ncbi:MAG: cation:proton antiporter [candidate division Zixibacteria bacterium CG_4_9_14_3_um_filter_46_8]|nr:MAG: cation:proton antiporter [candidate division Zixibacteria bacterium CG_4_9_14_3_um_filter_46_8]